MIELHEPEEGQALKIGSEYGVHFEMDLSDDVMLKSYMIEIHSNFDHHSHGKSGGPENHRFRFTSLMIFPERKRYIFIIMIL